MLAMQYSFTLPADYDMAIIQDRITRFGHLLDNAPQLLIKAYLYAQIVAFDPGFWQLVRLDLWQTPPT